MLYSGCKRKLIKIFLISVLMVLVINVLPIINVQAELLTGTEVWFNSLSEGLNTGKFVEIERLLTLLVANHFSGVESNEGAISKNVDISDLDIGRVTAPDGNFFVNGNDGWKYSDFAASATDTQILSAIINYFKAVGKYADSDKIQEMFNILNDPNVSAEDKLYYQAQLEDAALKAINEFIGKDNFRRQLLTDGNCLDNTGSRTSEESTYISYGNNQGFVYATCDGLDEIINQIVSGINTQEERYAKKIEEMKPNVSEEVKEGTEDIKNQTQEATENASADVSSFLEWFKNPFGDPAKRKNDDLSMDLQHLIERTSGFDNAGELKGDVTSLLNDTVSQIIDVVGSIGRYIMYALILFFGARIIWSGVEGKSQFKELLPYLLVGIIFFWAAPGLIKLVVVIFSLDSSTQVESYLNLIFSTVVTIVRIMAFGGIIFTGIKLMFSYSDRRADAKSSLLPVLIGCIIVFSASLVVNIVLRTAKDAGINTETSIEDIGKE